MRGPLDRTASACLGLVGILVTQSMRLLPLKLARALGRLGGRATLALLPKLRRVGRYHLDMVYGDTLSDKEKRRILRGAAENMGIVVAEFSRLRSRKRFPHNQIMVEGLDLVAPDKPAVVIACHMANWEWFAAGLHDSPYRICEIVRVLRDPVLNHYVDTTRSALGVETIERDRAAVEMIRRLRDGWKVGVLVDQCPRKSGVPGTFMGHACWSAAGPVLAAMRAKAPIHPLRNVRMPDGRYQWTIYPALQLVDTGNFAADLVANVQQCQDVIESFVREHPEQWLWYHRRWKQRPSLEEAWAQKTGRR